MAWVSDIRYADMMFTTPPQLPHHSVNADLFSDIGQHTTPYPTKYLTGYSGSNLLQWNTLAYLWTDGTILCKRKASHNILDYTTYKHYRDNTSESDIVAGRYPRNMAYSLWHYGDAYNAISSLAKDNPRLALFLVSSKVRRYCSLGMVRVQTRQGFTREYPLHPETMVDRTDIIQSILANRIAMAREYPSLPAWCVYSGDTYRKAPDKVDGIRVYPHIASIILGCDREYHNKARTPVGGYWLKYDAKDNTWNRYDIPEYRWGTLRRQYDRAESDGTLDSFHYRFHRFIPNTIKEYLGDRESRPDYGTIPDMGRFIATLTESEQRAFEYLACVSTCCTVTMVEHCAQVKHGTVANIHHKLEKHLIESIRG